MVNKKIGFIGAGNMAYSLIGGLLANGANNELIWINDKDSDKKNSVAKGFSINSSSDNAALASQVDIIILAVKPQVLKQVCEEISASLSTNQPLVISIAAGINTSALSRWLNADQHAVSIIRCMPNTPALVQSGATALYAVDSASSEQKASAESIMRAVGTTVWLDKEEQMDAVTAISGSGPAYYFQFIEIMERSAITMGLDSETAHLLAVQTAFGASKMALESEDDPKTLREKVTSAGGTTERALQLFAKGNLEQLIMDSTEGARQRSIELSKLLGDN